MKGFLRQILHIVTLGFCFSGKRGVGFVLEPGIKQPHRASGRFTPIITPGSFKEKPLIANCRKMYRNRHGLKNL